MTFFFLLTACVDEYEKDPGVLVVSQEQQGTWVRNFNPLLASGMSRWPTSAGIYEPLFIYSPLQQKYVSWLATDYNWNQDATQLDIQIREGVQWSDGQVFSIDDVLFTFLFLQKYPAVDNYSLWSKLSSVEIVSPEHQKTLEGEEASTPLLRFTFQRPCFSGLESIAHQPIIPEHIWSTIENPITFTNPEPVGTGPFTKILRFDSQIWELGRNPNYWQEGKPEIDLLRFPAYPSNEQSTLALLQGEVDWAGNFLPAIDRIFVSKDPENHHYWFPLVGTSVLLYPNHTKEHLNDTLVRKALSMAIDREKMVRIAMYDYTKPATESGLSPAFGDWEEPEEKWTTYNPERAIEYFEKAGYVYKDQQMLDQDGNQLHFDIAVVSGWSDWVRAAQVVSMSFRKIGVSSKVVGQEFGAWFHNLQSGTFDLSLGWSNEGPTPASFYAGMLSQKDVLPVGEAAPSNWHRYGEREVDDLLEKLEATPEPSEQKIILQQIQNRFVEAAPALPLFLNPSWGEYNTTNFVGWPSEQNPYARISPNNPPETLLVMTNLRRAR